MVLHRKQVHHYHEPGDLHELTFSCYRRMSLLTNDPWRRNLARSIDVVMEEEQMELLAFVFMPEHVHLLVLPLTELPKIDRLLAAIKQPTSSQAKHDLEQGDSRLLRRLMIRERPGKFVFDSGKKAPDTTGI